MGLLKIILDNLFPDRGWYVYKLGDPVAYTLGAIEKWEDAQAQMNVLGPSIDGSVKAFYHWNKPLLEVRTPTIQL